ncbi:exodeoxyribonuclease VII large subunit [Breoghania sp.]|uniref:exodeoxyribonuclease VII large subunit n=1 Tax=Breoghania sp. TaxID=2065378 RepID=UPI00262D4134|nr:exodeoxyribonuclease VII large subunit [Breoghania sp.]MDJ0930097.1 exodeoxyribonuclease VII large subunit [Breoghania sp.]
MAQAQTNAAEFTVSEISGAIKRTMEDTFGYVRVRGEVSGYRGPHSSGHCYFSLKDEKTRLEAVIWRNAFGKLKFKPEEGLEVIATGRITTFPGSSKYQIVIDSLEPAGVGALMALLEERRKKLMAEGLFDAARKKQLPYLPQVIGVVTSPTGAVIRDILHRLSDRFPLHVLVWPVRVQGEACGEEVAEGIRGFNAIEPGGKIPRPDVIIVARGGGSLEDLWSFNDEVVVRAAADSDIPLISAVGHETDWTLIDHAADMRAPTPTGAAEIAVPVKAELVGIIDDLARRNGTGLLRLIQGRRTELRAAAAALPRDLIALPRQRYDMAAGALGQALKANTATHRGHLQAASGRFHLGMLRQSVHMGRERLSGLAERADRALKVITQRQRARLDGGAQLLDALSYKSVLNRGYAVVRDEADAPIARASGVSSGIALRVEFADGTVEAVAAGSAGSAPRRKPKAKTTRKERPEQGDLF